MMGWRTDRRNQRLQNLIWVTDRIRDGNSLEQIADVNNTTQEELLLGLLEDAMVMNRAG